MAWPAGEWRETIGRWLDEPTDETLMAISILLDGRTIQGPSQAFGVFSAVRDARNHTRMLRLLLRLALASKPPTGFLHDIVVEHSGDHRGRFDVKQGGLLPIVGSRATQVSRPGQGQRPRSRGCGLRGRRGCCPSRTPGSSRRPTA